MVLETLNSIVTGIFRVKTPDDKVILRPDNEGVIRARLLSGIEIEVADGQVTYDYDDPKVTVVGGVTFDELEIIQRKPLRVRQPLTPRQKLRFLSRITEDTTAYEAIEIES